MTNFKTILAILTITALTCGAPLMAQTDQLTTTNTAVTATSATNSEHQAKEQDNFTRNAWIGVMGLIAAGLVIGYVVRSKRKNAANTPQTGASINNPASGI
jgi:hypothetical protein